MRCRFAPTPSGPAHPGTLLAGLLCWLDARSRGAHLTLRLGDVDFARCTPALGREMRAALAWLGLDWDGEEHQTAIHQVLQRQLGLATPAYRHHLVLEGSGGKLAKLHGAVGWRELAARSAPEALCGFLALAAGLREAPAPTRPRELLGDFAWERVRCRPALGRRRALARPGGGRGGRGGPGREPHGRGRGGRVKTVVFACVQSAGRSQMAAGFFARLADPEVARAISAGTDPAERVHPEVVEAMREVGVDLSAARPRLLTAELAAGAALLVTMGCGDACPVVPGLRREDWPLPDPRGQPPERVREIREQVRERVAGLVAREGWQRAPGRPG
jgi:arsenate reductase